MTHVSSIANEILTERQDRENIRNIHGSGIAQHNYFELDRAVGGATTPSQVVFECQAYTNSYEGQDTMLVDNRNL